MPSPGASRHAHGGVTHITPINVRWVGQRAYTAWHIPQRPSQERNVLHLTRRQEILVKRLLRRHLLVLTIVPVPSLLSVLTLPLFLPLPSSSPSPSSSKCMSSNDPGMLEMLVLRVRLRFFNSPSSPTSALVIQIRKYVDDAEPDLTVHDAAKLYPP